MDQGNRYDSCQKSHSFLLRKQIMTGKKSYIPITTGSTAKLVK